MTRPRRPYPRDVDPIRTAAATTCAVLLLGPLLAGCSSPSAIPLTPATTQPSTPPALTPTDPSPPSASPFGSSPSPTARGTCDPGDLQLRAGRLDSGAGQRYLPLIFTNTGTVPCTLRGYPGVAALDQAGTEVAQARRRPGAAVTSVRLAPGGSASAVVQATAVPSGTTPCPADYVGLLVTPPGTTVSVRLPAALPACGGLRVSPVVAGSGGV
jgi:Protein of unknown function (DUF4232)